MINCDYTTDETISFKIFIDNKSEINDLILSKCQIIIDKIKNKKNILMLSKKEINIIINKISNYLEENCKFLFRHKMGSLIYGNRKDFNPNEIQFNEIAKDYYMLFVKREQGINDIFNTINKVKRKKVVNK